MSVHLVTVQGAAEGGESPAIPGGLPVAALYAQLERELLAAMARVSEADARQEAIGRAEALVYQLHAALDLRQGGELARRLAALYGYFVTELRELRRTPDCDRLDELLELAVTLRGAVAA
jgi:flagellin-specific chaperone FliS